MVHTENLDGRIKIDDITIQKNPFLKKNNFS